MEEWDLYDKHRVRTGKVIERGDTFNPDEYHLVIYVCIINSSNQLLIQQRQPFKEGWSNMWDLTVGGSAHAGETSNQAAERELFEEIGYKSDLSTTRPVFTVNFSRGFDDYYVVNADMNLETLRLQEAEVKSVKWAYKDEIIKLISMGEFIPYHLSVINMIFDMKNRRGVHSK